MGLYYGQGPFPSTMIAMKSTIGPDDHEIARAMSKDFRTRLIFALVGFLGLLFPGITFVIAARAVAQVMDRFSPEEREAVQAFFAKEAQ